ncbi:PREDICTED: uncharacterized protein LOC106149027 [Chinchilla lanigera]|uniref:uncharacterized protein LOC106149027 n=1 Tax=Chinchilla lanigera TaxID=34839 RepID=UPI000696BFD9|nr:PREDICTED: uncharacterized protein LOC106149027 [Chinchilla lanigera]
MGSPNCKEDQTSPFQRPTPSIPETKLEPRRSHGPQPSGPSSSGAEVCLYSPNVPNHFYSSLPFSDPHPFPSPTPPVPFHPWQVILWSTSRRKLKPCGSFLQPGLLAHLLAAGAIEVLHTEKSSRPLSASIALELRAGNTRTPAAISFPADGRSPDALSRGRSAWIGSTVSGSSVHGQERGGRRGDGAQLRTSWGQEAQHPGQAPEKEGWRADAVPEVTLWGHADPWKR